ncbi:MAG TPA: enolase C-terminal domain-like protein [Chloroflexota bacterium]|nr:enolase C-terminal domain-like protein [Chloroflexota bacterium]
MKIVGVTLKPLSVLRSYHTIVAAPKRTIPPSDAPPTRSYFVHLQLHTDNGLVGLGEVSDYEPDSLDVAALQPKLEDALLGADPFDLERLTRRNAFGNLVDCAIDSALYDLQGKSLGVSVTDLVGGRYRDRVLISWVVYIRRPDLVEQEMEAMVGRGFRAFKLKVGLNVDHDDECVGIMRRVAGPGAQIKLDASGAWSVDDAIANIRRLARHGLQGVETPTNPRDVDGLSRVSRSVETPIIEHVGKDLGYALSLARASAVNIFNVATVSAGGLYRAKRLFAIAEAAGIQCLLGSTVELGIGTAGQLHLAASNASVSYPSDLIGPAMYVDDFLIQPFTYEDGCLLVPTGPGLGVEIDPARLERLEDHLAPEDIPN